MTAIVLPDSRFDVASFGALVSDPSRAPVLLSLMDGRARPAGELARVAGVTPQTASAHLQRLVEGGLLQVERSGRHRYFRLASEQVAEALEGVSLLSAPARAWRARTAGEALARARMCYRHLAGRLGVACLAAFERARFLGVRDGGFALTKRGTAWFESTGLVAARWPLGKPCLDWTERRHHLGGSLGGLLADHLGALGWIARRDDGRALRVTEVGCRELRRQLGIAAAMLAPEPGR